MPARMNVRSLIGRGRASAAVSRPGTKRMLKDDEYQQQERDRIELEIRKAHRMIERAYMDDPVKQLKEEIKNREAQKQRMRGMAQEEIGMGRGAPYQDVKKKVKPKPKAKPKAPAKKKKY